MDYSNVNCPSWISTKIEKAGGVVSFHSFMDMVLNDPVNGYYGSGQLRIGESGDFVTSPSLGPEFASLLSKEIINWLLQLQSINEFDYPLSLIEIGPGEGTFSYDLLNSIEEIDPELLTKIDLILVEKNIGMEKRQRDLFSHFSKIKVKWSTLEELSKNPVFGIVIANEVLDALPVERIIYHNKILYRQGVKVVKNSNINKLEFVRLPIHKLIEDTLEQIEKNLGVQIPPNIAEDGWCSELHVSIKPWFEMVSKCLINGAILVIDYALEAKRYYTSHRNDGTLISYKDQEAISNFMLNPSNSDLTSHLCLEMVELDAKSIGLKLIGNTRQGQALLALGLADKFYDLQSQYINDLAKALKSRESLLRLVDPLGLGEFRWMAFQVEKQSRKLTLQTKFLQSP